MSAPAWKSAPDVPGLWLVRFLKGSTFALKLTAKMRPHYADHFGNTTRYYGPIPEDKEVSHE